MINCSAKHRYQYTNSETESATLVCEVFFSLPFMPVISDEKISIPLMFGSIDVFDVKNTISCNGSYEKDIITFDAGTSQLNVLRDVVVNTKNPIEDAKRIGRKYMKSNWTAYIEVITVDKEYVEPIEES